MRVGVIDYGVGNLGSVLRALEELHVKPVLVDRAIDMHTSDALILPGVGNFTKCANLLTQNGWITALREEVIGYNRPLLGICLGMQLLADSSSEGISDGKSATGLGLVPGDVEHLKSLGCAYRVPHVGWNEIEISQSADHLFFSIPDGTDFYFVHSYGFVPKNSADILATVDYGIKITAAVRHGHVWGTQFHPEKSSHAGMRVLRNFLNGPNC